MDAPYRERATRRRPLQLDVDFEGGQPAITLIGPYANAREALYRRLADNFSDSGWFGLGRQKPYERAQFDLGGTDVELIDWRESNDPLDCIGQLGRKDFALCVDPRGRHSQSQLDLFLDPAREGQLSHACVVLVAEDRHLDESVEKKWLQYLKRQRVSIPVFRVNCADSMSPEWFAKLFVAGVQDRGCSQAGIEVHFI